VGLYDSVICEVPLPDGVVGEMQTKDMDCELARYTITGDGRLMVRRWDVGVPADIDVGFHGIFHFHCLDGGTNVMHVYSAKFTDGVLVGITVALEG
jgi:hypothetical protein